MRKLVILAALPLTLSACVLGTLASTAVDVVTLPVKAASAGVDAVTTSQSEADQKRGRELRKAEEKAGREAQAAEKRRIAECKAAAARGQACPPSMID